MRPRSLFIVSAALAALLCATPVLAADISVNLGQPGFYGRIDIGTFAPPRLIYQQPMLIAPAPVAVMQRPIYLRVPPGHAKDWSRHCGRYNACAQQTYFVQEDWYQTVYAPSHRHDRNDDRRRGGPKHSDRDHRQRSDQHRGNRKHGGRDDDDD